MKLINYLKSLFTKASLFNKKTIKILVDYSSNTCVVVDTKTGDILDDLDNLKDAYKAYPKAEVVTWKIEEMLDFI